VERSEATGDETENGGIAASTGTEIDIHGRTIEGIIVTVTETGKEIETAGMGR
jgi:hypothetical protein